MEIKIGMRQTAREIVLDSELTRDEIAQAVSAAMESGSVLTLDDSKGRRVLVSADALSYVELGEEKVRRVGFGVA